MDDPKWFAIMIIGVLFVMSFIGAALSYKDVELAKLECLK